MDYGQPRAEGIDYKEAYDYDGVISVGFPAEEPIVIITNRPPDHPVPPLSQKILEIHYNTANTAAKPDPIRAGVFKARLCRELGINCFYDNDPIVAEVIKTINPSMVVTVTQGKDVLYRL